MLQAPFWQNPGSTAWRRGGSASFSLSFALRFRHRDRREDFQFSGPSLPNLFEGLVFRRTRLSLLLELLEMLVVIVGKEEMRILNHHERFERLVVHLGAGSDAFRDAPHDLLIGGSGADATNRVLKSFEHLAATIDEAFQLAQLREPAANGRDELLGPEHRETASFSGATPTKRARALFIWLHNDWADKQTTNNNYENYPSTRLARTISYQDILTKPKATYCRSHTVTRSNLEPP